ncbi:DNA-binding transcriptional LysR family regulator [Acinetobacter calcoaceticus]|uniref:DNA-binding transcriptional LysR family regulator n=1 Tax=Acinetobacter calcoaceticus TaxID=471 RepID=A0A4R1XZF1_ACICA|nr:DNA-binding transcriptional LysR family regulator [Acinetobacter calcoaceticus]
MRLDFFDLQLFLNIVDSGSLTKGAERSAISLQAASERIKKLELSYQVSLFYRHSAGVKLTLAGQCFAQHAQALIQDYHQLQQQMQGFVSGQQTEILLWCNSSAQSEYLPLLLPQYLNQNPQLRIDFKEAESTDIIHALQKGQALLGIVTDFFAATDLQTLPLFDDPLVLICPHGHALAAQAQLDLVDVIHSPFVGLMQYHSLQQSIENQAKVLGAQLQYRMRLPNFNAIAQVVADGVGIAIMPKRAALRMAQDYDFQQIELSGAWANRKLQLAAKNFAKLPLPYQHLTQFFIAHKFT